MTIQLDAALAVLVVLFAVPLTWIAAIVLFRRSRETMLRRNKVMRGVAITLGGLAWIATVFAIVFVNNEQDDPWLSLEQTKILTRTALLVVSVASSLYWLRLYRNTRG